MRDEAFSRIGHLYPKVAVPEEHGAGEAVVITRRGKPIAELVPRCSVRDLLPQLAALREALPEQQASGVETMRALREESRA
jgi:antitoxin (DNA-binding transcriptional repressor) of toxin-antitoxin stability system